MTLETDSDRQLAESHSDEFLSGLTETLRQRLQMDVVWVGEVTGKHRDRIRVISGSAAPNITPLEEYELCGAPCAIVVQEGTPFVIEEGACQQYPLDKFFSDNGVAGYCAVPLLGAAGAPIGLLGVCHVDGIREPDLVLDELTAMAPRTAAEIESSRVKTTLKALSSLFVAERSPEELFKELAVRLADAFRANLAVIAEWREGLAREVMVLAYIEGSGEGDSMYGTELSLEDVPCGAVAESGRAVFEHNVQEIYPGFPAWSELRPAAYVGTSVYGTSGESLGYIAIGSEKRIPGETLDTLLWTVFANQIAVYIEQLKTQRERRRLDAIYAVKQQVRDRSNAASVLGHDIGNLLTTISASAELCELENSDERVLGHTRAIQAASAEATKLSEKLIHSRSRSNLRSRTDVADFLEMLSPALRALGGDRTEVVIKLPDERTETIADQDELAQVLLNLVGNAVDACEDGGTVTVSAPSLGPQAIDGRFLVGGLDESKDYISIVVEDTGSGIAAVQLQSLFRDAHSTKPGGHGIGLLAVRDIVSNHGGAVAVSSELARGTVVTTCWPRHSAKDEIESAPEFEHWPERKTVLVVDDEPSIRLTLHSILERFGFEPLLADGGTDAIEVLDNNPSIAAAIVDISMPGMDGWTLLTKLRSRVPSLPAVMMSAYFPMRQRDESSSGNDVAYLPKPFRIANVYESLMSAHQMMADNE